MSLIEPWWRVTRPSDGHVTWTPEDPSDRLVAAWEDAKVEGPFVPVPDEAAIERGCEALYELSRGQEWPGRISDVDVRHVGLITVVDAVLRAALGDGDGS